MMYKPLVSVIMGVHNTDNKEMLKRSINSILNQTYRNIEFIICDDGSTNNCYEWIKEITKKDSRVVLLQNEKNEFLATTLNRCICESNGNYIARQDDDDISLPTRIEKQVEFLEKNKRYDFVGSNCYLYNENKGVFLNRDMPEYPKKEDFLFNSPFIHGSVMFKKNCNSGKLRYAVTKVTSRTEDYEMFMRMYAGSSLGANLQEYLYSFHYDSKVRSVKFKYRIDEAKIRYRGFKKLDLLPRGYFYIVKPLVLGFIPSKIINTAKIIFKRQ